MTTSRVIAESDIIGLVGALTDDVVSTGFSASKNVTKSGDISNAQMLLNVSGTLTGVPTSVPNAYQSYLSVTSDNMDTTSSTDRGQAGALLLNHIISGAAEKGGRVTLNASININGATGNAAAGINPNYVCAGFYGAATVNDGGISGTPSGQLYGFNPNIFLGASATYWSGIIGGEINIAVKSGASVSHKVGLQIVPTTADAVAGDLTDAGLVISNQTAAGSGSPGWSCGIQFGNYNGYNPIAADGTLIGAQVHGDGVGKVGTVTNGVDLTKFNFTGNAFSSPGFSVDGSGNITANNLGAAVSVSPIYVAGKWYIPPGVLLGTSAANPGNSAIKLFPFIARADVTISDLSVRLGGTASAGGGVIAALYASDPTTGLPTGTPLATGSAAMSTTTSASNPTTTLGANYQLQAGTLYYLASQMDNTTAIVIPISANGFEGAWLIGGAGPGNLVNGLSAAWQGYQVTNTYASGFPDLTSATITNNTTANSCPAIIFKVASVP